MSRTPETDNLARGNHVVPTQFAKQLEMQRDEARVWAEAAWAKCDRAEKMLRAAAAKADQWRECAEKLAEALRLCDESVSSRHPASRANEVIVQAWQEFLRMKEDGK